MIKPRVSLLAGIMGAFALLSCGPAAAGPDSAECNEGWGISLADPVEAYRNVPQRLPEGAGQPVTPEELKAGLSADSCYWRCFATNKSELFVAQLGYGGSPGNFIKVYTQAGRPAREIMISEGFKDVDVSAEGLIAAMTPAMGLLIYSPLGKRVWSVREWAVRQALFDAPGRYLACLVQTGRGDWLRLVSAENGALVGEHSVGENSELFASPDLKLVALREGNPGDFMIRLLDFPSLNLRWSAEQKMGKPGAPTSLQWGGMIVCPERGYVAFLHYPGVRWTGDGDYAGSAEIVLLDIENGERVCSSIVPLSEGMRLEWHGREPVLRTGKQIRIVSVE